MGRANWKLKYIAKSIVFKIIKESTGTKLKNKLAIITNKSSTIAKALVDSIVLIHRGDKYRELKLLKRHIGFKFGEFILTRKPHVFRKKIKTNRR